jgi:hypothetical protein
MTQVRSDSDFGVKSVAILVNRSSGRHHNTGQQRLYEFCYLFPFDLWTSYLVRILFLQGCGSWFWEFPSSTRIFNALQYNLQVWQWFINVVAGGASRRDVVWRRRRLSVVPPIVRCGVFGRFFGFNHKIIIKVQESLPSIMVIRTYGLWESE